MNYLKLKYIKYFVSILFVYILFSLFIRIVNIYFLLFLIVIIYLFYKIDKKLFKKIVYKVLFKNNDLINKIIFDPQTVGGIAFIIPQKSYLKIKNILEKNEIVFSKIGYIDNSHSHLRVI